MNKISLSVKHKRALNASVYLVEKIITEMEHELNDADQKVMEKIITGNQTHIHNLVCLIQEIKANIRYLADKYSLQPTTYSLSQVVNARKTKIWEVLCDTKSSKMKSRGEFPEEFAQEFDEDIENLLHLTEKL